MFGFFLLYWKPIFTRKGTTNGYCAFLYKEFYFFKLILYYKFIENDKKKSTPRGLPLGSKFKVLANISENIGV